MSPEEQFDILDPEILNKTNDCRAWSEACRISANIQLREFEGNRSGCSPEEEALRRLVHFRPDHEFFSQVYITRNNEATAADAVSIDSKSEKLHCYEIKASRNDLIRELALPKKSSAARSACHFWWIVISGPRFCYDDLTIPEYAGFIDLHLNDRPRIIRPAEENFDAFIDSKLLIALAKSVAGRNMIEGLCLDNSILRDRVIRAES